MNRDTRRALGIKLPPGGLKDLVGYLMMRMAEDGPKILGAVREAVGGREPRPGEVVDVLVQKSVQLEGAVLAGRFTEAAECVIAILFLARDVAVRDGRIQVAEPGKPS